MPWKTSLSLAGLIININECFTFVDLRQVFPFGSFPLKTYLPDGDIDLTVINHEDEEENLAKEICTILECANDLIYQVKDIEHIRAQVWKQNFLFKRL